MMNELVFHSIEELKAYLRTVPEDVILKITVEEGSDTDGKADGSYAVQHE